MSLDDLISAILKAEGGSTATNDPSDGGGRTQYGISETSNPDAWADGVVTEAEARRIYYERYIKGPGFDKLDDPKLQHLMVDFAVTSGPSIAIQCLQRVVGADVDGRLGPRTLAKVVDFGDYRTITNRVVIERLRLVGRLVSKNRSQARFAAGWINRITEFFQI